MGRTRLRVLGVASVGSLLAFGGLLVPTAQSASGALSAVPAAAVTVAQAVGISTVGTAGWEVQSSATATQAGSAISTPGFATTSWDAVQPDDAGAPGTEVEAVLQNGGCPNVFVSNNMQTCFGATTRVGAVQSKEFAVPWWFRTDFNGALQTGQDATLVVNGVVGQADVWVNGKEVATQTTVQGALTRYTFDITSIMRSGDNTVALEVYPNDPQTMYTLDDVDWSQIPPDNNTGIQFPIQLHVGNALSLDNTHVVQADAANLSTAALTVKTDVTNHSTASQTGTVSATITPPGGGAAINVSQSVTVAASATTTVSFTPSAFSQLTISKPQVWWPYQMGAQPLYQLSASIVSGTSTAETQAETFGIRTVTSSLVGPSTEAPSGVRLYSINGQPFVFRGGGWSEQLFLHYSAADTAAQILLMKGMGVNGIRTEGKEMPADFYNQMDKAGILIDGGFQCCDMWQNTSGLTTQDYNVIQLSAQTIGQRLRNHPSVFTYGWSDNAPSAKQETSALAGFSAADFQVPFISSAEYNSSPTLGASGEKEGPYDWVPPNYWYDTSHFDSGDSTRTNVGGSWGFDSEESPGDTVPTLDSIQRFLSTADQTNLWSNPSAAQYHTNYEGTGHSGYAFGTLFNLDTAITSLFGKPTSLDQYVEDAQVQNYDETRAQFEAFIDHWNNATPSTGTVYWQMNKGWPTLLWSLYNNDYDESGSYFGAEQANQSLHALFALDNNTVTVDNLSGATQAGLGVVANVYNTSGTLLDHQTVSGLSLASQAVKNAVITPKIPATTTPPTAAQTYFVEVTLTQNGTTIDRNVYWLSTQQNVVNWSSSEGNPQAKMTQYADLTALQSLPTATVSATATTSSSAGNDVTAVTITNTSTKPTVGFFLRADVRKGTASGTELSGDNEVLPITWSDNDITLWPGESQTLTATYAASLLQGASPVVSVSGWNAARFDVAAPGGTAPGNGFSVSVSPTSGSVVAGSSTTATVNTAVTSGSAQSVALSASGAPAGVSVSLSPASVTAGGSSTLTASTTSAAAAGMYPITITGTAASGTATATYTLVVTSGSSGPTSYEAESSANTLAGGATVVACAPCSGGARVGKIGAGSGTLTFNNVTVPTAGTYQVVVAGTQDQGRTLTAYISVNGAKAVKVLFNRTASWTTVEDVTVPMTLNAGSNTIEISNPTKNAPDIDVITVP